MDGFHGRTYGALSLTGQPSKQEPFRPLVPGVVHVERDDLAGLEAAVGPRTCAIVMEMVQGEIGVQPVPHEMLRLARELADRHGALLVLDEIQTGLSRTGPLWAHQDVGVVPDVMCWPRASAAACRSGPWWRGPSTTPCCSPATTAPRSRAARWPARPRWPRARCWTTRRSRRTCGARARPCSPGWRAWWPTASRPRPADGA